MMDSTDRALETLKRFCAYQDRCHNEVKARLRALGLWGDEAAAVIAALIEEDYLNEERFARSYARGKFRMKGWGRIRITRELEAREVSPWCIRKGLEEIDPGDYEKTLRKLARQKYASLKGEQPLRRKYKTTRYLLGRGYESALVGRVMEELAG